MHLPNTLRHVSTSVRRHVRKTGHRLSSKAFSIHPDPSHVDIRHAPASYDNSAVVYPNFITEEEGKSFIKEVSKKMKRRRFEEGHWDSVIVGYREVELVVPDDLPVELTTDADDSLFVNAVRRTRKHLEENHLISNESLRWIPCHAIDLSADGRLDAHVDSVKFSGDIVAGISLLSDSIMRLKPCSSEWKSEDEETGADKVSETGHIDLYLPKQSLYVLAGMSRFSYTHELLPAGSPFRLLEECIDVDRRRRLSIIFRDELRSGN